MPQSPPNTPGVPATTFLVAEVAPAAPTSRGDGIFDYVVPPEMAGRVRPGVRVVVPLAGRKVEGFCLALKGGSEVAAERLKAVADVLDTTPAYPAALLNLAVWTAGRYLCRPGEVLRAALPSAGRFRSRPKAVLTVPPEEALSRAEDLEARAPLQAAVLRKLAGGAVGVGTLRRALGAGVSRSLAALHDKGLVQTGGDPTGTGSGRRRHRPPGESPVEPDPESPGPSLTLTPAQRAALAAVTGDLARGGGVFLLHGVTGSGKTEVYLRAAAETLSAGRQVLLLVPEVSLVPQTVERVRAHLGRARVAVAHSYLSRRERLDYWERVVEGRADVVVGARSAVFAPLDRPGLIILDEEHEDSYKQEEGAPRYHAREVAVRRARHEGATLVLASATPSIESYHRAVRGEWTLLSLPERVRGRPLPPVDIVDMRAELATGNRGIFSRSLSAALGEVLREGRQAILFLNRRGHSTFVLCRDCGWVARCPHCDVSLTYHQPEADLVCHWCGHHSPPPDTCPGCGGHRVRFFGAGTQRVEAEVQTLFPEARVTRLDTDVARKSGEAGRVLAGFSAGLADVLVGTQMGAKGLDLPGVGLVAAVAADSALNLPDFRAPEKTFRLLTQAAGRAGRGDRPGRVIIQTYNPDHPAVVAAGGHDYRSFARAELLTRRDLGYPPWNHLIRVEFSDPDETQAARVAEAFSRSLTSLGLDGGGEVTAGPGRTRFIGPAPAPLARIRGRYRWHVLVFVPDLAGGLDNVARAVREVTGREARGGRRKTPGRPVAAVDVDPVSVL